MTYTYIKECFRDLMHTGIDYAIPSTPLIGAISGGVGFLAHNWVVVYFPQAIIKGEQEKVSTYFHWAFNFIPTSVNIFFELNEKAPTLGWALGFIQGLLTAPTISLYHAERVAIGSSLATSVLLNVIAANIFGIKIKKEGRTVADLQTSIDKMGIKLPMSLSDYQKRQEEPQKTPTIEEICKDIKFPIEVPERKKREK